MKAQFKTIVLIAVVFAGPAALADAGANKPSTRIDFNKMIEDNNIKRNDLHQDINRDAGQTPAAAKTAAKQSDKSKAIDFIDVEIGVGQAPAVTDRRFDSVGEARLASPLEIQSK